MTGHALKARRIELMISRGKIADQMGVSSSRTQQIESTGHPTPRMSERYISALEEIMRKRASLGDAKNVREPFSIPEFASGTELQKIREAHRVTLADLARVMEASRAYVAAIEARGGLRQCTVRRYCLSLFCLVSVRKDALAQK